MKSDVELMKECIDDSCSLVEQLVRERGAIPGRQPLFENDAVLAIAIALFQSRLDGLRREEREMAEDDAEMRDRSRW